MAAAASAAEHVRHAPGDPRPAKASPPYSAVTQSVPTRPSSSPMIAKMKSLVDSGTQPHLLPAGAEAHAEQAARPERVLALDGLLVGAGWRCPAGAGSRSGAGSGSPGRDDQQQHGQGHQDQHAGEHPAGSADDPQQREEDDQQDEGGARGRRPTSPAARARPRPASAGPACAASRPACPSFSLRASRSAPQTASASLAISDGWNVLPADVDPPRGAVLRDADAGDERQAEPDDRHREQRVGQRPEHPGRRARRHPHDRQADQVPRAAT